MFNRQGFKIQVSVSILFLSFLCLFPSCKKDTSTAPNTNPDFTDMTTSSFYLTMIDGVKIAVDLHLPTPIAKDLKMPTIIIMTRYWRSEINGEQDYLGWRLKEAALQGYASVIVDERGTGASFGTWHYPWMQESLNDYEEIVNWVVEQDWSNGKIGAWGISYFGMTAQLLPIIQHPAVRVIIPTFTQYDLYTNIAYPGGIFNDTYVDDWNSDNQLLDMNLIQGTSVKPVDSDTNGYLLQQAITEHANNGNVYEGFKNVTYRDVISPSLGISLDDISAHTYKNEIEQSGVAIFHWGSWMDHGGAQNVLSRFLTLNNPQQAVIGVWTHGGFNDANPYTPPGPPIPAESIQWDRMMDFFDKHLKEDATASTYKELQYYTLGAEQWKSTTEWPIPGTINESWYFNSGNLLSRTMPTEADSIDTYAINFTATTGTQTRWDGDEIYLDDRAEEDKKLLTYTSEPLLNNIEITGQPIVTLYITSTHSDGAFYVYLEDVSPSGRITYLTEGELRALHRKVSENPAPYEMLVPYHSFKAQDGQLLIPGEITEITFGLMPISVVINAGHRIRVAIAGHDADWFARIPETGDPVITVERNIRYASFIELPVLQ